MPATAQVQAQHIDKFINGWASWEPNNLLSTLSSDCTQRALPFRSETPPRSRQDLEQLFPVLLSTLTNFKAIAIFHRCVEPQI
jgi:hypothetical protein